MLPFSGHSLSSTPESFGELQKVSGVLVLQVESDGLDSIALPIEPIPVGFFPKASLSSSKISEALQVETNLKHKEIRIAQ